MNTYVTVITVVHDGGYHGPFYSPVINIIMLSETKFFCWTVMVHIYLHWALKHVHQSLLFDVDKLHVTYWLSTHGTLVQLLGTAFAGHIVSTGTEHWGDELIHAYIAQLLVLNFGQEPEHLATLGCTKLLWTSLCKLQKCELAGWLTKFSCSQAKTWHL